MKGSSRILRNMVLVDRFLPTKMNTLEAIRRGSRMGKASIIGRKINATLQEILRKDKEVERANG